VFRSVFNKSLAILAVNILDNLRRMSWRSALLRRMHGTARHGFASRCGRFDCGFVRRREFGKVRVRRAMTKCGLFRAVIVFTRTRRLGYGAYPRRPPWSREAGSPGRPSAFLRSQELIE
jgi:hypothetical protein